ncbi:Dip2/Utp12 family-domain-containing protein [Podospora appendiculata]|uniref:Dip2/Utp12 family-domain-containing protein n=1 Tax=Podospora appendiculata TaxID=314037 RepID=A0AAE1C8R5_9PEZI|nr:Dip2/Utp12 family-domain-containing protein [Podospora appendiculata]
MSTKRKPLTAVAAPYVKQSAKAPTKSKIDETRTSVTTAGLSLKKAAADAVDIESDLDEEEDNDNEEAQSEDDDDDDAATPAHKAAAPVSQLKVTQEDTDMVSAKSDDGQDDPAAAAAEEEDDGEATFGDLVRGSSTVDVPAALAAQAAASLASRADASAQHRSLVGGAALNSTSLGTVLNQALRTDDADLLESCLQTSDVKIIQNTINRMDSSLAGVLLSKLAARMHRRPGRAFGLMKWMQWTMVAHGGTLVTQPDLVTRLGELNRVLEERSRGLSSLLALKGKLDMLDAQMRFRKSIKASSSAGAGSKTIRAAGDENESEEEDEEDVDEPGVVYVEGEDNVLRAITNSAAAASRGADDEDDFPVTNGIDGDSEDESEDEDYDDGAEDLADEESMDEDEVDHDDVDESGEDSDGEVAGPPAKVQKVSSKFAKKRLSKAQNKRKTIFHLHSFHMNPNPRPSNFDDASLPNWE